MGKIKAKIIKKSAYKMRNSQIYIFTTSLLAAPALAFAADTMPWTQPLNSILNSLENDFLKFACITSIILTGLILAFGEDNGGVFRRVVKVVLGLSIACSAASFGLDFFGYSGT